MLRMRRLILLPLLTASLTLAQSPAPAKPAPPAYTLRTTLLRELHATHDHAEWHTPLNTAVAGLTPEQARWVPTNAGGKLDPPSIVPVGVVRCFGSDGRFPQ